MLSDQREVQTDCKQMQIQTDNKKAECFVFCVYLHL